MRSLPAPQSLQARTVLEPNPRAAMKPRLERALAAEIVMLGRHAAHRARARAHDDALGRDAGLAAVDALQQRSVGDSGCGEDAVALGHVLQHVDAVQVVDPPTLRTTLF